MRAKLNQDGKILIISSVNNDFFNIYKLFTHLNTEDKIKFLNISKCHSSDLPPNF